MKLKIQEALSRAGYAHSSSRMDRLEIFAAKSKRTVDGIAVYDDVIQIEVNEAGDFIVRTPGPGQQSTEKEFSSLDKLLGFLNPSGPRAYTAEEVRDKLLAHVRAMVAYWDTVTTNEGPMTQRERLDGLAFSILVMLDGDTMDLPAFDLYPAPHPEDKAFHQQEGENWFDPECPVSYALHEFYYIKK